MDFIAQDAERYRFRFSRIREFVDIALSEATETRCGHVGIRAQLDDVDTIVECRRCGACWAWGAP